MISIIPEREILKSVTDKNIDSPASQLRAKAFAEATNLLSYSSKSVEIVIEGNLYELVSGRLIEQHKMIFEEYEIDKSGFKAPSFNITGSIKFIIKERKIIHPTRRVIVLTENTSNYAEYESGQNDQVRIFNPDEFLKRITLFETIKRNYSHLEDALITAFFIK